MLFSPSKVCSHPPHPHTLYHSSIHTSSIKHKKYPPYCPTPSPTANAHRSSSGSSQPPSSTTTSPSYYDILGLLPTASPSEIKSSYRKLALQLHPDVNDAPDANQSFTTLGNAYDILSSPESRKLYDKYGAEGMLSYTGAKSGFGNARQAWDEFKDLIKPRKKTRKQDARDDSMKSYPSTVDDNSNSKSHIDWYAGLKSMSTEEEGKNNEQQEGEGEEGDDDGVAPTIDDGTLKRGDVVEYPLAQHEIELETLTQNIRTKTNPHLNNNNNKNDFIPIRTHGIGLLVARNRDRGDASSLLPSLLDICEIEPLRQEWNGASMWVSDDLGVSVFIREGELKKIEEVDGYDAKNDIWNIQPDCLSEGCSGPFIADEVIL
jgi:hypothetical protein